MPDRYTAIIRRFPLFASLPQAQFDAVVNAFQVVRYEPGEFVLRQGESTTGLHIIINGNGLLLQQDSSGQQKQVGTLQTGQFINQDALYRNYAEPYSLQVARSLTALYLSRDALLRAASYDRELAEALNLNIPASYNRNRRGVQPQEPQNLQAPQWQQPPQVPQWQPQPPQPQAPQWQQQPQPPQAPQWQQQPPQPQAPQWQQQPQPPQAPQWQQQPQPPQAPQWQQQPQPPQAPQWQQQPQPPQAPQWQQQPQPAQQPQAPQQPPLLPEARTFPMQNPGESLLLMTRRHWLAYARFAPVPLLVFAILAFGAALVPELWFALLGLGVVICGAMLAYLYAEWANDAVYITDERVLRVNRTIFAFREVVSEVTLDSIQEINANKPARDPFAVLFNYGSVEIRSAGAAGNFVLDFVPNPDGIQETILKDQQQRHLRQQQRGQEAIRADIDRWLGSPDYTQANPKPAEAVEPDEATKRAPLSPFKWRFTLPDGATVYRKHWVVWLGGVMRPGLLLMLTIGLFIVNVSGLTAAAAPIAWGANIVMLLVSVLWFYYEDWDWRNDYMVVNDSLITIIHKRPLFLQNEDDQVLLRQVDNVVSEVTGFWRQLFRYGEVRIGLVGSDQYKEFKGVPDPSRIRNEITARQARIQQAERAAQADDQRQIIGEYLAAYDERLRQQRQSTQPTDPAQSPYAPTQPARQAGRPAQNTNIPPDNNRPPNFPRTRPSNYDPNNPAPQ